MSVYIKYNTYYIYTNNINTTNNDYYYYHHACQQAKCVAFLDLGDVERYRIVYQCLVLWIDCAFCRIHAHIHIIEIAPWLLIIVIGMNVVYIYILGSYTFYSNENRDEKRMTKWRTATTQKTDNEPGSHSGASLVFRSMPELVQHWKIEKKHHANVKTYIYNFSWNIIFIIVIICVIIEWAWKEGRNHIVPNKYTFWHGIWIECAII